MFIFQIVEILWLNRDLSSGNGRKHYSKVRYCPVLKHYTTRFAFIEASKSVGSFYLGIERTTSRLYTSRLNQWTMRPESTTSLGNKTFRSCSTEKFFPLSKIVLSKISCGMDLDKARFQQLLMVGFDNFQRHAVLAGFEMRSEGWCAVALPGLHLFSPLPSCTASPW